MGRSGGREMGRKNSIPGSHKFFIRGDAETILNQVQHKVQHDSFYSFSVFYEGVKYFISWFSLEPLNPGILEPLVFL